MFINCTRTPGTVMAMTKATHSTDLAAVFSAKRVSDGLPVAVKVQTEMRDEQGNLIGSSSNEVSLWR